MIELEFKKNYLTMIENAAKGQNWMFRNLYLKEDGIEKDALENGGLSCSSFVTSILYLQNSLLQALKKDAWIGSVRARVVSAEKDLLAHGWQEIQDVKPGAVLIWEQREGDSSTAHEHIGFAISETEAISNDSRGTGFPFRHPLNQPSSVDTQPRKVEKILWHSYLDAQ
jgi:hypothetical protein